MPRLDLVTAGESHGPALVALLTGVPAGLVLDVAAIDAMLARRQLGYGRGGRMKIEQDRAEVLSGMRHGHTIGSPLTLRIPNRDASIETLPDVSRPRPGHADLAGMLKYGTKDARDVLERASARETAARVAGGAVAIQLLAALGVRVTGFLVSLGPVSATTIPDDLSEIERLRDASPLLCPDPTVTDAMIREVDAARDVGDTLGGVVEVRVRGLPPGVGGYVVPEERLDGRLAGALMRIQAMKAVEIGLGFESARRRGSDVHDEILGLADGGAHTSAAGVRRAGNRSGGIEGGMTTGEDVVVRVAMKPLSTLRRALRSIDVATGESVTATVERSDVCAAPAASVVAEAVVALVLADALLTKTGGDSMDEVRRNLDAYRAACASLLTPPAASG
ncbi:MAG: chorismate synthase [Planctomycetes bacterium]|nr:chorismate synthase [Planctomycetota bacterium]